MSSPKKISKWGLQIKTWLRSVESLLGVCWVFDGSMICEIHGLLPKKLFQLALQMGPPKSSPNELSKLRPGWSLLGVHWESAGSPLGAWWKLVESLLEVCWESAGSLLGVCWESAGSPLGVRWESTGSPLGVVRCESAGSLSKRALQMRSPNYNLVESVGSLLGVHWKSTGSPMGVCWEPAWLTNNLTVFLLFPELLQP